MFKLDELKRKSGIHRTYSVYYDDEWTFDPFIRLEIELVILGKVILSVPVWRYKDKDND